MDFSSLPLETQVNYLLKLDPKEILAYCSANSTADNICQSEWFWDQKGIHDFGYPVSVICQQNPYWQYWVVKNLVRNGEKAFLPPLVRSGNINYANEYVKNIEDSMAIDDAIESDDIATLKFLEPYIMIYKAPEETYYMKDPFWYFLSNAFNSGSRQAVEYLISLDLQYLQDTIILDEILTPLVHQNKTTGIRLLHPYIEKMVQQFPDILRMVEGSSTLKQYIIDNFAF